MSLKAEIVKTALTVAISWEFPEAVVMPVIAGGAMDYFADVYDDSEDKKKQAASEKIDKAYLEGRYGGVPVFSTVFPIREG